MRGNDLANGVGVDESHVEYEWDEMVFEDHRLQIEVNGYEGPGVEVWDETFQGWCMRFGSLVGKHMEHTVMHSQKDGQ